MKIQQTITYIKNGKEKTVKVNKVNKNYILTRIFKIYTTKEIVIDTNISLIHFKNIVFSANKIKCRNLRTICIFENCTFKQSTSPILKLKWGSFELINPNFIDVAQINGTYLEDFILTISDKNTIEQKELSIDISADNIKLQGNLLSKKIILSGNNITLGNEKIPTHIKLICSGLYRSVIEAEEQLILNKCLIENVSKKPLNIVTPTVNMDDNSIIKTNRDIVINGISHQSSIYNPCTITKKDIIRMNLFFMLKVYNEVLKTKIEKLTNKYATNELYELNHQIEIQENNLNELKEKLCNEQINKNKAIVKSLSKKTISYLQN